MNAYAPDAGVTAVPPHTTAQVLVLLGFVVLCVALLLFLVHRSLAEGSPAPVSAAEVAGARSGAAASVRLPAQRAALDEDDVIAFGRALEACPDVARHLLLEGEDRGCTACGNGPASCCRVPPKGAAGGPRPAPSTA